MPTPIRSHRTIACLAVLAAVAAVPAAAAPVVWTQHNDNARTGWNPAETTLTPAAVNTAQFGKLFSYTLDDQTYSQPLYVPSVVMAVDSQPHNVVFVATVNNSVYAWDADSAAANGGGPLWRVNLTPAGARPPKAADLSALGACGGNYTDFSGNMGIVGTPVIDPSSGTLYVVARTIESGAYVQRLHALDIASGAEKLGGPVTIAATYNGVAFDPLLNNQRPALALVNGVVYIGWSSHCDFGAYHGWVIGYRAADLAQVAAWSDTSGGGTMAGIWQAGQALMADTPAAGTPSLYFMTGNGTWDGVTNFGESFVKLGTSTSGAVAVADYFTPSNWSSLNGGDTDRGSAGALGILGTTLLVGGGKQGMLYLVDSGNLGRENATDRVVQEFQATFPSSGHTGHIHGSPVYFDTGSRKYAYVWGENDFLRVFEFTPGAAPNQGSFNSTAVATSSMRAPVSNSGMPGGFMSVSSNGNASGIVWALTPYNGDANHGAVQGILHAFDAQTFSGAALKELWNSKQNAARDDFGNYAKFTYPTVANGRVYLSSWGTATSGAGQLWVYGPITTPDYTLSASPSTLSVAEGSSGTSVISVTGFNGFSGSVALSASGLPSGVTASFSPATTTTSSTLTLTASSTAAVGTSTVTITGTSGSLTHTTTISLTITGNGTGGPATFKGVVKTNTTTSTEEDVTLSTPSSITSMTITITVQPTNVSYSSMSNTVGSKITMSHTTGSTIVYTYRLRSGQTVGVGSYTFAALLKGNGRSHSVTSDKWSVTYTSGGQSYTQSGVM